MNRKCKRKSVWKRTWIQCKTYLQTIRLQSIHMLFVHCQKGTLSVSSFCYNHHWYVDEQLSNGSSNVYASSPPQKNYIHSKFILLYQVTFNEAMYPFNSNGKMWPVHRVSDMFYLVFKYLWCFNKLKMKACIVCEIARALYHAYLRPESIQRQRKSVVDIDLHCCFP